MTLADKLYQANEFGKHAAATGKPRIFSLDKRACRLSPDRDGIGTEIVKAWYAGFDEQELKPNN